jgi:hypothetical protein
MQDLKRGDAGESSESRESTEPQPIAGDRKSPRKRQVANVETQTWGDAHVPADPIARATAMLERIAVDLDRAAFGRKAAELRRLAERWRHAETSSASTTDDSAPHSGARSTGERR